MKLNHNSGDDLENKKHKEVILVNKNNLDLCRERKGVKNDFVVSLKSSLSNIMYISNMVTTFLSFLGQSKLT